MPSSSGPPGVHPGADVIQMRGRPWHGRTPTAGNAACEPADERDPHTELALTVEAMFLAQDRTLSDPGTAHAFQLGIDAAQLAVDAALAQGAVSEYGHQQITGMLMNMRSTPGRL